MVKSFFQDSNPVAEATGFVLGLSRTGAKNRAVLRRVLHLLVLLPALASAGDAEGELVLYLVPSGTPGVSAFCLRPDLPVNPLFRPPFHIVGCGAEFGGRLLHGLFLREVGRGLPNKLPPPHAPDAAFGDTDLDAVVDRLRDPGGPAVLVVMDPHLRARLDRLAAELPRHRAALGFGTGWVGWDARYDPGGLEVYSWEWCDRCHGSGPFDNSLVVCGFCAEEIGGMLPRLVWRDRLGRLHSQEAVVRSLATGEVTPNRALWYLPGGHAAEGR
jgi:hypothetical protein